MKPRTFLVLAAVLGYVLLGSPKTAAADQVSYVGVHPIPGGGFCHIEVPHVHIYVPAKSRKRVKLLYRKHHGAYYFVGDPVAYGYDGPRVTYYGPHPIDVDVVVGDHRDGDDDDVEYCYLRGPHYHYYAPPDDSSFEMKGDAYFYVGAYPPEYKRHERALVGINAVYEPMHYDRPVVTVSPPEAYIGPVVEVHGPAVEVAAPAVEVAAPVVEVEEPHAEVRAGIEVHIPAPRLEVGIGVPGVIVEEHHHHRHRKFRKVKIRHRHDRGRHRGWHRH